MTPASVIPLVLTRQHRSQFRRGVWFGPSWTSTFDARVVVSEDAVTTVDADGTMLRFDHPGLDSPQQPRHGRNWLLFRTSGGGYRLFSQDTERSYQFEPKSGLNGTDLAVGVLSISAITDRHDNRILFHYSDNGIPVAVTHSGGYRVDVLSDGARITGYELGGQGIALRRFGHDGGDLVSVTDGCGATTSFAYDGDHRMVAWTDSVGARYDNVYDADGRITSQQGTEGVWAGTFDFVSTSDGLVSTFTDAFGAQTAYEFDADLRPRRVMDPEGRITATEFNSFRDPVVVTAPGGAVTRYEYTEHGDFAAVTDALGAVTRFGYASPRYPNLIVREGRSPVAGLHIPSLRPSHRPPRHPHPPHRPHHRNNRRTNSRSGKPFRRKAVCIPDLASSRSITAHGLRGTHRRGIIAVASQLDRRRIRDRPHRSSRRRRPDHRDGARRT
ncbi:DUF6531 domain-containing protein [Mycobacterium camsae]|uniref:DUF6531 domain-containing protein n=1 Tax=Mycobacterium gordonae TaxID=1778 RepID=UPI0024029096|nr:DUF6531 domain-containing protein [Mycobacterium gordonae]